MKTPVHLWVIGIAALLWNAGGAYDYIMTQFGNEAYLAMLTEPQRAYMDGVPAWFEFFWGLGIWFAVLGSIFLLALSRLAVPAFGIAIIGLAGSSVYSFGVAQPSTIEIMGSFALIFTVVIALSLVLLWFYARAMARRGVLR
ncbi:MAG: hypothetical protein ABF248_07465 [Yoonia sp.]